MQWKSPGYLSAAELIWLFKQLNQAGGRQTHASTCLTLALGALG